MRFNPLNHEIVPHQELLGGATSLMKSNLILRKTNYPLGLLETDSETGEPRLAKELLPKILITIQSFRQLRKHAKKQTLQNLQPTQSTPRSQQVGLQTVF